VADLTPPLGADALIINSYTTEGFTIAGVTHQGAVLLAGGVHGVALDKAEKLEYRHLLPLRGKGVSYLIIGCGQKGVMPSISLVKELREMGIVAEAMSTAAACRTYNVLLAEGRPVAALLLPV
jgi:uncharacterized protein